MALYTFRCEKHGDFQVEQPMAETTREVPCLLGLRPHEPARKVVGANLQFRGGRAAFHDGIEGTGETGRETFNRWMSEAKADGVPMEPVGTRWV